MSLRVVRPRGTGRRIVGALLVGVLLVAGACSDDGDDVSSDDDSESSESSTTLDPESEAAARGCPGEDEIKATLAEVDERGAPTVTVPAQPATELGVVDQVPGTGPAVEAGNEVLVHYSGHSQSSGKEFDSSWPKGQPVPFGLDQVIPGWSEGLVGMKVGGRREIVIPGEQAYGDSPPSPDIAPNDTLVFVVDMVATC